MSELPQRRAWKIREQSNPAGAWAAHEQAAKIKPVPKLSKLIDELTDGYSFRYDEEEKKNALAIIYDYAMRRIFTMSAYSDERAKEALADTLQAKEEAMASFISKDAKTVLHKARKVLDSWNVDFDKLAQSTAYCPEGAPKLSAQVDAFMNTLPVGDEESRSVITDHLYTYGAALLLQSSQLSDQASQLYTEPALRPEGSGLSKIFTTYYEIDQKEADAAVAEFSQQLRSTMGLSPHIF